MTTSVVETKVENEAVHCSVKIDAPPEAVWPFLVDAEKMQQWCGQVVNIDPKPGGSYRVQIQEPIVMSGSYKEVVPNEKVVIAWGWEGDALGVPPGSSTVEISLHKDGDGTIVKLVHSGLPEPARVHHGDGWTHYLNRLAIVGTGGDPGRDPKETMEMQPPA